MSSRQLRKLQQQRELEQAKLKAATPLSEEESEEEESFQQPTAKPSLFAGLAGLEGEGNDSEDGVESETSGTALISREDDHSSVAEEVAPPPKTKKSKKKKKAKKGAEVKAPEKTEEKIDDIDAALRELNLKAGKNGVLVQEAAPKLDPEYERVCKLLGINNSNLKVANEMKNLFGRAAIENNEDAGGAVPGRRGGRRNMPREVDLQTALKGHHLPGKGLPELTLRRNIFIQGKDDWPRGTTGGLTMEVVDDEQAFGNSIEYRFVHDQAYNVVQQQFDMFVEMGEPNNLIGLLQRNPYHISLLLQVCKIAKNQSDHALSSDLLERALFTFARSSLSNFSTKLAHGKARLDFARPENRELWLAGLQYIKSLIMKGTYHTALEWAKLLLSLDPEDDPYCMILMVHHLALRAHEFQWLLNLGESDLWQKNALAAHMAPSLAYAAMQLKQGAKCRELLSGSIQEMPWVFTKLFQELNLSDPPPSIWGSVPGTQPQTLFTEIYVRQTKDLWNAPEATTLLMEVAQTTNKLTKREPSILDDAEITLDVARFVYLDNTPGLMSLVPSKLMHRQPNSDSDPLPPDHNLFSWPSQRRPFEQSNTRGGALDGFANPFNALREMLPFGGGAAQENGIPNGEDDHELREQLGERLGWTENDAQRILEEIGEEHQPSNGQGVISRALQSLFNLAGFGARPADENGSDTDTDEEVNNLHARVEDVSDDDDLPH